MRRSPKSREANEKEEKWLINQLRLKHFDISFLEGKKIVLSKGRWTEIMHTPGKVTLPSHS